MPSVVQPATGHWDKVSRHTYTGMGMETGMATVLATGMEKATGQERGASEPDGGYLGIFKFCNFWRFFLIFEKF